MKKYLANGREVILVEKLKSGFLVQDVVHDGSTGKEYPDYRPDGPWVVKQVFDKAPIAKYDKKIIELNEEIDKLNKKWQDLADKIRQREIQCKTQLEKYKKYDQLKRLDDFLEHKITYYVELGYSPKIMKFDDEKCSCYKDKTKLLTLFGNSKGDLQWKLNNYFDGSGYHRDIVPCVSLDEAKEVMQKYIDFKMDDKNTSSSIIDVAKKWDLAISADYIKRYHDNNRDVIMKDIVDYQQKINRLKDKLQEK